MTVTEIIYACLIGALGIIGTLIKIQVARIQSDVKENAEGLKNCGTKAEVDTLFKKHDIVVHDIADVKLTLAGKHYERTELDIKFEKLDTTIKEGFRELSVDLKEITISINETYKDHIKTHHSRDGQ